ncbi:protein of unknown function (plasmid) [Methylocella tundrae]|uniref:Uncharacterized protein n=1 Tax=Methylocella tundrae TaxID=227605 RepID=A0A4U8Z6U2_METTU|nr:protein of unknown function [Methylocella tundrae]
MKHARNSVAADDCIQKRGEKGTRRAFLMTLSCRRQWPRQSWSRGLTWQRARIIGRPEASKGS